MRPDLLAAIHVGVFLHSAAQELGKALTKVGADAVHLVGEECFAEVDDLLLQLCLEACRGSLVDCVLFEEETGQVLVPVYPGNDVLNALAISSCGVHRLYENLRHVSGYNEGSVSRRTCRAKQTPVHARAACRTA
jgi:hypothetical protein